MRFHCTCITDMKAVDLDTMSWECSTADGTPAFVSSVTIGAATSKQEITKIENKHNTSGCITHGHI